LVRPDETLARDEVRAERKRVRLVVTIALVLEAVAASRAAGACAALPLFRRRVVQS
jgi:hypothetical protein